LNPLGQAPERILRWGWLPENRSANGNVTPCAFVPFVLGSLRDQSLERLWRRHCAALTLECRGDCPMNIPWQREALRKHVDEVAQSLVRDPCSIP